jgi:hypothetical protein
MCSIVVLVPLPWPAECRLRHPWQPGTVAFRWEPCDCPASQKLRGGHFKVICKHPGCKEEWWTPLHNRLYHIPGHSDDPYR